MKKFLALLLLAVPAFAQNPQSQAPLYAANAKYVNGVAPGYAPTMGSGLTLNLGSGAANCSGTMAQYAGGTLTLTANATNYVYLNTASSCVPAVKTSSFNSTDIPLATVVTGANGITSIVDDRTPFSVPGGASGNATQIQGQPVASTTPASGQGLVYNGTSYAPATITASAGGSTGQLQFNNAGALGGVATTVDATGSPSFLRPVSFQGGPRFGAFGYIATGDSITYGVGVSSVANSYAAQLSNAIGGSYQNYGISGSQSEDWAYEQIFPYVSPTPEHNPVVTALILHNDLHFCSTSSDGGSNPDGNNAPCIANAQETLLASLSWATIPITQKQLGNASTSSTGTWATDTTATSTGYASSTSGSTATYTVTTTNANQPVYVWWIGRDSNGGTATLSIDSASQGTLSTASTSGQCICTNRGGTNTVWGSRYVIASAGTHTLVFDVTSATSSSNTFTILGVGTPTQGAPPVIAPPSVFIMSPIYEENYNIEAATNAYTAMLSSLVAELDADGLLVIYRDSHPYLNVTQDMSAANVTVPTGTGDNNAGTTCSAVSSGNAGQHPNICGHTHLFEAFMSMIQPAPLPGGTISFPTSVSNLDSLHNLTSSFSGPIISGINDYSTGTINAAGQAFGNFSSLPTVLGSVSMSNAYAIYSYSPSNFFGHYYGCVYASGSSATLASGFLSANGFTGCDLFLPNMATSTNTAGSVQALSGDASGQYFTAPNPASSFSGNTYPIVQGPGNTNLTSGNFAGIENRYVSGALTQSCLTVDGSGAGAYRALCALPDGYGLAPNGLIFQGFTSGPLLSSVATGSLPSSCTNGSLLTLNNNVIVANATMAVCVNGTYQIVGDFSSTNAWTGANSFSVSPTVPTPTAGDNSTKIATTAFVSSLVAKIRAGTVTISSSTTATVTFTTAMSVAPTSCALNPSASSATTGQPYATAFTTTGFTANLPVSGTLAMTYQCVVNNSN